MATDSRKHKKGTSISLAEGQNWRCAYCAGIMTFPHVLQIPSNPSVEHVIEFRLCQHDNRDNQVAACLACNNHRPDVDAYEFLDIRQSLLDRWPPCTRPNQDVRAYLVENYGYYSRSQPLDWTDEENHSSPFEILAKMVLGA